MTTSEAENTALAYQWMQDHMLLVVGLPLVLIVLWWLAWRVARAVRRGAGSQASSESLLSLADSALLTPEERARVRKKLHERLARELENQTPNAPEPRPKRDRRL